MKKLKAPYVTNTLLFIIACELLFLPRRKEVFTINLAADKNVATVKRRSE